MAHWQHRPEPGWQQFHFQQPYAKGLARLKDEVLAKTDFDPATLWQWGTMQALAVIEVLKTCERAFGREGQTVVYDALRRVGLDIGRQVLAGVTKPKEMSDTEFMSYYATVINRIVYASLEAPAIDGPDQASFDILWCPHQDHYGAFDCRVQRYFVQGMLDALAELGIESHFEVRFDSTIPAGASTCHFTMWRNSQVSDSARADGAARASDTCATGSGAEGQAGCAGDRAQQPSQWEQYTAFLDEKALRIAAREAAAAAGVATTGVATATAGVAAAAAAAATAASHQSVASGDVDPPGGHQ